MTREKEFFRQVMGRFATGVTIVTTATGEGVSGLTVNAFTSVSLNPPLVLTCIDVRSQTLPCLRASGSFAVNFLTNEQEALARCFATPSVERRSSFCHTPYQVAATGSPILEGVLAFLDARIVAEYPGGDHAILLGQVQAMGIDGRVLLLKADGTAYGTLSQWSHAGSDNAHEPQQLSSAPLVYYRGQYHRHLTRNDERLILQAGGLLWTREQSMCAPVRTPTEDDHSMLPVNGFNDYGKSNALRTTNR